MRSSWLCLCLLTVGGLCSAESPSSPAFKPEFFAFQTGFANSESKDPAYLAALVADAGFDGIELMGLHQVEAFLPELAARKLKLHSLYLKIDLDQEQPYDARLLPLLKKHEGQFHYLWFHIHSRRYPKSDPAGDPRCVEVLRDLSAQVEPLGVKIGIYHHVGLWAERFSDGVRVARKVDRANVGAVFNLCHYLRTMGPQELESELGDAFPHVMLVSINGADDGDTRTMGWDRLIRPLDEGTLDVSRVLRLLKQQNYAGPVGLQGFAVRQKPEAFFPRSVHAYRQYLQQINQQPASIDSRETDRERAE